VLTASRGGGDKKGLRLHVCHFSKIEGTRKTDRRHPKRRRATDAGHCQSVDVQASVPDVGRTLSWDSPDPGENDFLPNCGDQSQLGITILLVEQNANLALEISDYGYVLETGRIILEDESAKLRVNSLVKEAYLAVDPMVKP